MTVRHKSSQRAEYIPSTFDIHYSIFAFSEFLFRLDWPLFRPAARQNFEPFNPGLNKFIQVLNAITKRFIIANIHTEPAAGAVRCVDIVSLALIDRRIQNMGNQADPLAAFAVGAIFLLPFYSQRRHQAEIGRASCRERV